MISEPAIGARASVAIARSPNGFSASWVKIEVPDAGPDPAPSLAGFDVVDLDARGTILRREFVDAPPVLRTRKGSLEAAGVAREDGATLLHWIESVTSTDPDGRVRTAFAFKGAYGGDVVAPGAGACEQCTMRASAVALGDRSVVVIRTVPDVIISVLGVAPPPPSFVGLVFRRDGGVTAVPLPALAIPPVVATEVTPRPPPGDLSLVLDTEGRLVVTTDGRAWLLSPTFDSLAGPIDVRGTDARALWGSVTDASVAWSISPTEDGRSTEQFTRREIFLANGATRERLSFGRAVLAAERRADDVGVVFESAGREFFAASSPTGRKRGGDVFVRALGERGGEYGNFAPDDATALAATGGGRFTIVSLGRGALTASEVVCAP